MDLDQQKLYCQVLAQLLIIDGAVTDAEHQFLQDAMDRLGLDAAARQDVYNHVNVDDPIEQKIAALDPEARRQLTEELERAVIVDGEVSPGERDILDRIRAALEL
ncbi:MAG: TerB family tellurite resistance protein [Nannocystaceae bacterium]|nr:TerB family tellurite resistance protein [Myxococcales bacterium]